MRSISLIFVLIFSILYVSIIPITFPVMDVSASAGKKIYPNEYTEVTDTGQYRINNGKKEILYTSKIYSIPIYNMGVGRPIVNAWKTNNGNYYADVNKFDAVVSGSKVTVTIEGKKYSWDPSIYIGKKLSKDLKTLTAIPKAVMQDWTVGNNVLEWDYGDFVRQLRLSNGMISETYIFNSNPGSDIEIKLGKQKDDGFVWERPANGWDANRVPITVTETKDGVLISASEFNRTDIVYPITIDPTITTNNSIMPYMYNTGTIANYYNVANATDALVVDNTGGNIGQDKTGGTNLVIYRQGVYFDTSTIPSLANISDAYINLFVYSVWTSGSNFNVVIKNGQPTYPHDPMVTGDYHNTNYSGDGGNVTTIGMVAGSYRSINMTADGISWINKGSTTKFYLVSDRDSNLIVPTGYEHIGTYQSPGITYLYVTYYASAAPTVNTNAASFISADQATLNGLLVSDGGEDCPTGFYYGTASGNLNTFTGWSVGNITSGNSFNNIVSGLNFGTTYYYVATAYNSFGSGNGTEQSFATPLDNGPPYNFSVTPSPTITNNTTQIDLTFTRNAGAAASYIIYKIGDFPTDPTDGAVAYNGTGGSAEVTGLGYGTTYYFRAWGLSASGNFSATYLQDVATTFANTSLSKTVGEINAPSGWFNTPNSDKLNNSPIAYTMNTTADKLGIPEPAFWAFGGLFVSIMIGTFVWVLTRSILLSAIGTGVVMFMLYTMGPIPLWMVISYAIIVSGIVWVNSRVG